MGLQYVVLERRHSGCMIAVISLRSRLSRGFHIVVVEKLRPGYFSHARGQSRLAQSALMQGLRRVGSGRTVIHASKRSLHVQVILLPRAAELRMWLEKETRYQIQGVENKAAASFSATID